MMYRDIGEIDRSNSDCKRPPGVRLKVAPRMLWQIKGSRKNNLTELAFRFSSGLVDPNEQIHRNSELFRGFWEGGIGQRWAEAKMQKCEVISSRALSICL